MIGINNYYKYLFARANRESRKQIVEKYQIELEFAESSYKNDQGAEVDVTEADSLNITYTYEDLDNDTEITSERIVYWYQNSVYLASKDNQTILYDSETATGDYWQYQIRVYDGSVWSNNFTSALVVIGSAPNNIPEVLETGPTVYCLSHGTRNRVWVAHHYSSR